jgi:hypothetical protein
VLFVEDGMTVGKTLEMHPSERKASRWLLWMNLPDHLQIMIMRRLMSK